MSTGLDGLNETCSSLETEQRSERLLKQLAGGIMAAVKISTITAKVPCLYPNLNARRH